MCIWKAEELWLTGGSSFHYRVKQTSINICGDDVRFPQPGSPAYLYPKHTRVDLFQAGKSKKRPNKHCGLCAELNVIAGQTWFSVTEVAWINHQRQDGKLSSTTGKWCRCSSETLPLSHDIPSANAQHACWSLSAVNLVFAPCFALVKAGFAICKYIAGTFHSDTHKSQSIKCMQYTSESVVLLPTRSLSLVLNTRASSGCHVYTVYKCSVHLRQRVYSIFLSKVNESLFTVNVSCIYDGAFHIEFVPDRPRITYWNPGSCMRH